MSKESSDPGGLHASLIEASVDGVLAFDRECRFIAWNKAMESISGLKRDEVLGKCAFDVFPFLKETGESQYLLEALAGKSVVAENRSYPVPETGHPGFFEGYYSPLRNERGEVIGGIAIIRDITERKQAEELANEAHRRLSESEEQYRLLFQSNPHAMWVYDLETLRFLAVNEAAVEQYGYSPDEFLSMTLAQIRPLEDVPILQEVIARRTSARLARPAKWRHQKKNGDLITVEITAHQLNFSGRRAELVMAIDITERQLAEQALMESEDRYRDLVENSHELMCTHDLEGRILSVNPWAARVLGYEQGALVGLNIRDGLDAQYRDRFDDYLREIRENGFARGLMRVKTASGETKFWEYYNTLRTDGVQAPIVRGMAHDVTERRQALTREKEARMEAESANRLKDEFLSTLSHELRTPLTAIIGWSDLLIEGLPPDRQSKALEIIARNARSQAQLIDELLEVSRIITGKLHLDFTNCELQPVIEAALESLRPTAQAKAVRLELVLEPVSAVIFGDVDRLRQVIWNLLSNAVKFTPANGCVKVKLHRTNSHALVTVSDSGEGIKGDFLPHVFDRFSQADGSSTRKHGGLGLGLAIVRHLVEMHGGTVRADSPGEGLGATFTVSLPLMQPAERPLPRPESESEELAVSNTQRIALSPSLEGLRLLIVDDEVDFRELVTTMLGPYGAVVKAAASAGEALSYLENWKPDVLVADIGMRDEDGYGLIHKVRSLSADQGGETPAVALTAYTREEDRLRALSAGYHLHLAKPITAPVLAAAVANVANRSDRKPEKK